MTSISFKKLMLASALGLTSLAATSASTWSSSVFEDNKQINQSPRSQANTVSDIEAQQSKVNSQPPAISNAAEDVKDENRLVTVSRPYDGYFGWFWSKPIVEDISYKDVGAYLSKYPGSCKLTTKTVIKNTEDSKNEIVEDTENSDDSNNQHPIPDSTCYQKNSQGQTSVCLHEGSSISASSSNQNEDTNSNNRPHVEDVKSCKIAHEAGHANIEQLFEELYVNPMDPANTNCKAQIYIEWHNPTHSSVQALIPNSYFNSEAFNLDQRLFDLAIAQASKLDEDDILVAKPAVEPVDLSKLTGKQIRDAMIIHNLKNSENGQNPDENLLTASTVHTAINKQDFNRVINQWIVFSEFPDGETPLKIAKTISGHKILIYKSHMYRLFHENKKSDNFDIMKFDGEKLVATIAAGNLDGQKLDISSVRNASNQVVYTFTDN